MTKRKKLDGILWVVVGIGMCIGAFKLKPGSFANPGPGFMPFLSGLLLVFFGLVLMVQTIRERSRDTKGMPEDETSVPWNWRRLSGPSLTVLVLVGYVLLLGPLGFLLTSFLCLLVLFKFADPQRWLTPLVLAFGTTWVSFFIFSVWLKVQFPRGLLGF